MYRGRSRRPARGLPDGPLLAARVPSVRAAALLARRDSLLTVRSFLVFERVAAAVAAIQAVCDELGCWPGLRSAEGTVSGGPAPRPGAPGAPAWPQREGRE